MPSHPKDKYECRHLALLEARSFFGNIRALCEAVNALLEATERPLKRACVSRWLNEFRRNIPYEYCILIALLTGISLDRLSPFTKTINKIFMNARHKELISLDKKATGFLKAIQTQHLVSEDS